MPPAVELRDASQHEPIAEGTAGSPWTTQAQWLSRQWRAVREFRGLLRRQPFDSTTPDGRSKERYRRAALTTLSSVVARVLGIFTGLAAIRLSLSYLGKERYGLWLAIGSLVTWANLADLGLARGMQNHLSEANGRDDRDLAARYVSTGIAALCGVAAILALVGLPLVEWVPWAKLLNVRDASLTVEARQVVAAVAVCFLAGFPLAIVPTLYSAYQRGYIANLFAIAGSAASLAALLVAIHLELTLPALVLASGGALTLMALVNFGYALHEMPWLRPKLNLVSRTVLGSLASTSVALFVFQLGALLITESQSLIVARRVGLSAVADWSIFMRVYTLPLLLTQMIDMPLIPAFREAHVRGERSWLITAFWRVTKLKLIIGVGAAVLYLFLGNRIATLLAGQPVVLPMGVWIAAGFLLIVSIWNVSFNDLMISVDRLRVLVVTVLINGLVTPAFSYVLVGRFGILGVLLGMSVFSAVVSSWLLPFYCRDLVFRVAPTDEVA